MEHVKAFQAEIDSLSKTKPPISKAKMSTLTKGAMKAIKFYKHVVQAVEKFISKCKPEYKVPGLYIIDSIIRQSRHQYGIDKDLFATRFCKNICSTFQSLYKCPEEDVSKIVRVLNLWQKNGVLPTDVIQPLMDLAKNPQDPSVFQDVHKRVETATVDFMAKKSNEKNKVDDQTTSSSSVKSSKKKPADNSSSELDINAAGSDSQQTLQRVQLQQLNLLRQQLLQQTEMLQKVQPPDSKVGIDSELLANLDKLTQQLVANKGDKSDKSIIDKKLLDYDYGDSEDDEDKPAQPGDNVQALQEAMLIQQLKQMNEALQKQQQLRAEQSVQQVVGANHVKPSQTQITTSDSQYNPTPVTNITKLTTHEDYDPTPPVAVGHNSHESSALRHRSRRSRSRSPTRMNNERSRERREREHREREERERQRKKQGLPASKPGHVIVCSCTLWIGHLSKQTMEKDLSDLLSRYGKVTNVFLIKPRGCAYVTIESRADAAYARDRLPGVKLLSNSLKVAWAPPKSINEDKNLKTFWDVDAGAAYIPWGQMPSDLDPITASGEAVVDPFSLPSAALAAAQKPHPPVSEPANISKPTSEEQSSLPGLGGIINTTVPAHIALSGGALPPIQPGQVIPVSQTNVSNAQNTPSSTANPNQLPNVPGGLPPGVQLMMQATQSGLQGLVPIQMPDGQMRLVGPAGHIPGGLIPGLQQLPPSMAPGQPRMAAPGVGGQPGQGLVQLPAGLVPIRQMMPGNMPGGAPNTGQLEQALHDLMNNKAAIQAVAANSQSSLLSQAAQFPVSLSQPIQLQASQASQHVVSLPQGLPPSSIAPSILQAPLGLLNSQPNTSLPPPGLGSLPPNQQAALAAVDTKPMRSISEDDDMRRRNNRSPVRDRNNRFSDSDNRRRGGFRHGEWGGDRSERGDRSSDRWGERGDNRNERDRGGGRDREDFRLEDRGNRHGGNTRGRQSFRDGPSRFDQHSGHPDFDVRGPPPGMWRGGRPPFNIRGPPPRGWHPREPPSPLRNPNFSPRGPPPPPSRFPLRDLQSDNDELSNVSEKRERPSLPSDSDMSLNNEERKSKRSRWSNDPQGSKSGLDDASQKLAITNAQEVAARFSKPQPDDENNAADQQTENSSPEPVKSVVDITQVNTEETVSNVLGQLYDDDDDDDDNDDEKIVKADQVATSTVAVVNGEVDEKSNETSDPNGDSDSHAVTEQTDSNVEAEKIE